ncbi:Alpha/Beta hydrolase protein [Crucibulum laeve]|uniref:Alpha/Beta hydrolase protein n=1 Tax=Crucibulum laeve TaxID=68775 RepID=A0A5C3LG31_9AGAR|nr:Alpha/Beta hydrolase protein [Crucibulum laeve]
MPIYDKNPPYPHYDHLPYAKEPWKSYYVWQRLFTTLLMCPIWATYYLIIPRRYRPRASWNIRQIINVNFTRRIYKVTEVAGVTWGTRDPTTAPPENSLKETRFEWVDPLPENLRTGIVNDGVPFTKVGCYVWPKEVPGLVNRAKTDVKVDSDTKNLMNGTSLDLEAEAPDVPLVGIFMHGGGYCHMSAHENSGTSNIPRGLIKNKILHEVYSVEYRLLQVAPFPAVIQDAAAVYAHVVNNYNVRHKKCKIILIGDSSGGNLVLALSRWLRDEGNLPLPHGLLLLSPSCDTSHALPETLSSYIPRPNEHSDYLVDTPEPRALLQRTFLGFKYHNGPATPEEEKRLMVIAHSEYVSPCSPVCLKRWGHEVKQDPNEQHEQAFRRSLLRRLNTSMSKARLPETLDPRKEMDVESPYHRTCKFPKLFGEFPRTLVVCGDAERLVREVRSLITAMQEDGVDVTAEWAQDACHDVLMMSEFWWDKKVLRKTWMAIKEWAEGFERD